MFESGILLYMAVGVGLFLAIFFARARRANRAYHAVLADLANRSYLAGHANRAYRASRANRAYRDVLKHTTGDHVSYHLDPYCVWNLANRTYRDVLASSCRVQQSKAPASAQYLLELMASPDWSEAVSGDFFERYERKFYRVRTKHGILLAKIDYWWQVLRSAPGLLRIRFRDSAALAGIAKLFDVLQKYWAAK